MGKLPQDTLKHGVITIEIDGVKIERSVEAHDFVIDAYRSSELDNVSLREDIKKLKFVITNCNSKIDVGKMLKEKNVPSEKIREFVELVWDE